MRILVFTIMTSLFVACNDNESPKPVVDEVTQPEQRDCYAGYSGRDTVEAALTIKDSIVTGTLNYRLFEKDRNEGQLNGTLRGDTLLADYTFNSEGQQSVRQVAFLRKNSTLIEGYGDVEEKNGKMQFKSLSALKFGEGVILQKTDCVK